MTSINQDFYWFFVPLIFVTILTQIQFPTLLNLSKFCEGFFIGSNCFSMLWISWWFKKYMYEELEWTSPARCDFEKNTMRKCRNFWVCVSEEYVILVSKSILWLLNKYSNTNISFNITKYDFINKMWDVHYYVTNWKC